jgi:hypothetical protein
VPGHDPIPRCERLALGASAIRRVTICHGRTGDTRTELAARIEKLRDVPDPATSTAEHAELPNLAGLNYSTDFERPDRRVMSACCDSFSAAEPSSERSTPQKLPCGCKHSIPAWSSFGESCLTHWTRNSFFFDPRCKPTIIPRTNGVW